MLGLMDPFVWLSGSKELFGDRRLHVANRVVRVEQLEAIFVEITDSFHGGSKGGDCDGFQDTISHSCPVCLERKKYVEQRIAEYPLAKCSIFTDLKSHLWVAIPTKDCDEAIQRLSVILNLEMKVARRGP